MRRRSFFGFAGGAGALVAFSGCAGLLPTIPSRPDAAVADAIGWISWSGERYALALPRVEMGQNISTALKQIACVELDVPWDLVDVERADTSSISPYRATVGSESVQDFAAPLAQACAALRDAIDAGRTGTIEATERPRERLRVFQPAAFQKAPPLVDIEAIVAGEPLFAADVRLPNMAFGRVFRAPISPEIASSPASWNETAARAEPGFVALVEDDGLTMNNSIGLGVVATTPGALDRIEAALAIEWSHGPLPEDAEIETELDIDRHILDGAADYGVASDAVDDDAPWDVDLRIDTPLSAHGAIEARAAVADMSSDGGKIWVGSQDPFFVRDALCDRLGCGSDMIAVFPMRAGGAFGGKAIPLVEYEAAALSRALERPVKVQWTREQELAFAYHRPATSHRVRARLRDGRIREWSHRMASGHVIYSSAVLPKWMQALTDVFGDDGAARNLATPYNAEAQSIGYHLRRLPIRTAAWRGLGAGPNTLASEMAVEECARAAGVDPIEFRLAHISDGRLRAALTAVRKLAGPAPGRGRGVGCGIYKGVSYGAVIADVDFGEDRRPVVRRLFAAHDCGMVVNADQVRAQCEGNLAWSLGMVLTDRLTFARGGVAERNFDGAPIPSITDTPPMEIVLIESNAPPTGAGETLMASAPAAIANGFTALAGFRPARLPFTADDFKV